MSLINEAPDLFHPSIAHRANEVFVPGCLKRKRAAKGKITKSEGGSLACARTLPLVSHCRRRLFAFSTRSLGGQQVGLKHHVWSHTVKVRSVNVS